MQPTLSVLGKHPVIHLHGCFFHREKINIQAVNNLHCDWLAFALESLPQVHRAKGRHIRSFLAALFKYTICRAKLLLCRMATAQKPHKQNPKSEWKIINTLCHE
jgi:hypothetical protein